jgi:hypothetical protein
VESNHDVADRMGRVREGSCPGVEEVADGAGTNLEGKAHVAFLGSSSLVEGHVKVERGSPLVYQSVGQSGSGLVGTP